MTRGGARPGAGSKPRAEAPAKLDIRVPVSPAEHAEIKRRAAARPMAAYLRDAGLGDGLTAAEQKALERRAKNAKMTPVEWIRHCIHHDATPVDQTPAAQRRRMLEALGRD